MIEEELFIPVDWLNHQEAILALETAEAAFAESCYIERHPPIPSEFVGHYTRAVPARNEPAWPIWAKYDLLFRCIFALRDINARDETYRYWRNIYTPEARKAARERRVTIKEASKRYHEGGGPAALEEMLKAREEIDAERGRV